MQIYCDMHRGIIDTTLHYFHRKLLNVGDNSIDICGACLQAQRRLSIYRVILRDPLVGRFRCDVCKAPMTGEGSAINSTLFLCSACLKVDLSLEEVSKHIHALLSIQ